MAEQAASERGRIDIWFNNAGFEGPLGPLEEADDGLVLQTLETNVKGVYSGMGWAIKHMPEGGLIVNNASFVGVYAPVPIGIAYGGSKAAVVSMTKAAAMALGERGIDVLCICPGIVDTPMVDRLTGGAGIEARQGFAAQLAPSGQLSQPEAVAEVVLELCTRSREYPSGSILLVDAGPTVSLI